MKERDIYKFSDNRTKARAYFCYLFTKNLPNKLPSITPEAVIGRLRKINGDLRRSEGVYLLDERGVQISPTYLQSSQLDEDVGQIRSTRAYYYRAMKEKRCTITDPYPSLITHELTITSSQPIFDENGHIKYVACVDMPLDEVLRITQPVAFDTVAKRVSVASYFAFSLALFFVAMLLFVKAIAVFIPIGLDFNLIEVKDIFKATILLTLALAIFDLVKTIFDEEVMGHGKHHDGSGPHPTMIRFLGSIIIALSIESLMLVFKFAMTDPALLLNAIYIIGGVALLLVSLAIYIKFTKESLEK